MVRVTGVVALLLIVAAPCLVLPHRHVLAAGIVAALVCAGGLLLPSLGVATAGALLSALVFSAVLLAAASQNAVLPAMLLGMAVLTLLDATYFAQRFAGAAIAPGVVRVQLRQLALTGLTAVLVLGVLAVVADVFWLGLDTALRPALAAAGGILVVLAILRGVTRRS